MAEKKIALFTAGKDGQTDGQRSLPVNFSMVKIRKKQKQGILH